jgi:hypothetical protein
MEYGDGVCHPGDDPSSSSFFGGPEIRRRRIDGWRRKRLETRRSVSRTSLPEDEILSMTHAAPKAKERR